MTNDTLTDEQAADLLPAYALGAVEGAERAKVAWYVATHPQARAELDALRRIAEQLHSETGPRPEVWDRIAARLSHAEADETAPVVVSLLERRERRERRAPRRLIAVAAALALTTGAAAALTFGGGRESASPEPAEALRAAAGTLRVAADEALTAPGAQQGTVVAADGTSVRVVVLPSRKGYVLSADLPPANQRGDHVYKLFASTPRGLVLLAIVDRLFPIAFELPEGATGLLFGDLLPTLPLPSAVTLPPILPITPPTGTGSGPTPTAPGPIPSAPSASTPGDSAPTTTTTAGPGAPITAPITTPSTLLPPLETLLPPLEGLIPSSLPTLPTLPRLG